jgi:hypothetical protein
MGESSRQSSLGASWGWIRTTPAGPEVKMKMEEDILHLVALGLAACELQTMARHELTVCSL